MKAWIFDIDGVLTNIYEKRVSEPSIFPFLAKILEEGDLLAFNTGREISWIKRVILTPLETYVSDKSLLRNIFIGAEKGGTWEQFGKEKEKDTRLEAPLSLREKIKKLVQEEFSDSMFFVDGKETMVSVEMNDDIDPVVFSERQEELLPVLHKYLEEENLSETFVLDPAFIATDIESIYAGKDLGMEHVLTWIEEHKHQPDMYLCFGDSPKDAQMGTLLKKKQLPFVFIYVGTRDLPSPLSFEPVITNEKFDKGTVEYLSHIFPPVS